MVGRRERVLAAIVLYALTAVLWISLYQPGVDGTERFDLAVTVGGLVVVVLIGLVILRLDLIVVDVGWGLFTYGYVLETLNGVAEASERVEQLVPDVFKLIGLVIVLGGLFRTRDDLRARLTERDQRLTVMNRVLRHNLRNNLSVIIGSLQHLEATVPDEDAETVDEALATAWDITETTEKLRRIDSVLSTADDEESKRIDLATVAESVVADARETYPSVEFDVRVSSRPRIEAKPGVEAAIRNLVENACEHNDAERPAVSLSVGTDGTSTATVSVRDNGSGIPTSELDSIRAGDESPLAHSSGVGLWFVHWIVERSGGTVSFDYDGGQSVTLRFSAVGGSLLDSAVG
jgi:signal transduction histidine kinase